jgi:hypothetical protein
MDTSTFRERLLQHQVQQNRRRTALHGVAIAGCLVLAIAGAHFGAAYVSAWRLFEAARKGNADILASGADWPALRANLRETLFARMQAGQQAPHAEDRSFRALDAVLAQSSLGTAVDVLVTPDSVAALARQPEAARILPGAAKARAVLRSGRFHQVIHRAAPESVTTFHVSLRMPGGAGDPPVGFHFTFTDWRWKLVRMDLPPDPPGVAAEPAAALLAAQN